MLRVIGASRRIEKPWGFEIWWAHTDLYAGKILHVDQGHRLSLQYHQHKDESCYLLVGSVRLVKGGSMDELDSVDLEPGACWRNQPGEIHTIEALAPSDVLEVSTPQLDDVVRLLDDYGRGQSVRESREAREALRPVSTAATRLRLIDREQLAAKLSVHRSELAEIMQRADFPAPMAYFRGRHLWDEAAIEAGTETSAAAGQIVQLPA
jgi:mannose-6-phosphate isomerase